MAILSGLLSSIFSSAPRAATTPIRIACIGNSITQGTITGVTPYPTKLQQRLGSAYQVENDGVSGCTLLKKGDKPYWTMGKFANVFAFKPSIITIKLGTNDSKPQNWQYKADFAKDLTTMIDTLGLISPKPVIWLCLPVPAWPVKGVNNYGIDGTIVENEIIPIIQQVAKDKGLKTIDLHTPMLGMQAHFADGVHPDSAGQDSISHLIYNALTGKPTAIASAAAPSWPETHLLGRNLHVTLPGVWSGGASAEAAASGRAESARLQILDLEGKPKETWTLPQGGTESRSLAALPAGVYLLSIESGAQRLTKRLEIGGPEISR